MKIAICDDEPIELENAKSVVDDFISSQQSNRQITLNTYTNANDLLCEIVENELKSLLVKAFYKMEDEASAS